MGANGAGSSVTRHARRFTIFGVVGIAVMLFGALVLYLGVDVVGLPLWIVYTIQVALAVNLSFLLNNHLTWADRRGDGEDFDVRYRWLLFVSGRLVSIALTTGLFVLFVTFVPFLLAHFLSVGVVALGNYVFNDVLVFRQRSPIGGSRAAHWRLCDRPEPNGFELAVVLPVKGNEDTVAKTVESLLSQELDGEIQVIVVVDKDGPAYRALEVLPSTTRTSPMCILVRVFRSGVVTQT